MAVFQCNLFSLVLCFSTNVNVFIPSKTATDVEKEYLIADKYYQVLYLLHGAYDDHTNWLLQTSIARYAQDRCLAVVMPTASRSFYQGIRNVPHVMKQPESYRKAVYGEDIKMTELIDILQHVLISELSDLYMVCGTNDFIFRSNENFYDKAKAMGVKLTYEYHSGVHDWSCWDQWIQDVLNWLPLKGGLVED